jgi:hypothetical protein
MFALVFWGYAVAVLVLVVGLFAAWGCNAG